MPSEEFDKKLREAADLHHPAYDEKAWEKMEALLDRHLPVEKKKRRRFLPWLFIFLVAGGGWLIWNRGGSRTAEKPVSDAAITDRKGPQRPEANPLSPPPTDQKYTGPAGDGAPLVPIDKNGPLTKTVRFPSGKSNLPTAADRDNRRTMEGRTAISHRRQSGHRHPDLPVSPVVVEGSPSATIHDNPQPLAPVSSKEPAAARQPVPYSPNIDISSGEMKQRGSQLATHPDTTQESVAKNESPVLPAEYVPCPAPMPAEQKSRAQKSNRLFFTVSAGPDLSFVSVADPGRVRLQTGWGIGFTFRDRLTLRTGYQVSRKIYSATPGAYKPPPVFWNYYPYLDAVEGDCRIAEIPLLMTWHVGRGDRRNWMLSAGVSSYLMKKEEYYYTYKNSATGPTLYRNWENHNPTHALFSVLSLSAGYRLTLSPRFQLLAEPYLRLPMAGVGYGKVRLNSGGVLFTLAGQLGRR